MLYLAIVCNPLIFELLKRAWPRFLFAIGTTGLGFFLNTIAQFFVCLVLTYIVTILWSRKAVGSAAMKEQAVQTVKIAVVVFVIAFPVLYGPIYYRQEYLERSRIIEESENIKAPRTQPPSKPPRWDVKFMQPFCYVKFETVMPRFVPQLTNGRWGFRLFVLSSVKRAWDGVAVRIRRQDRMEFLVNQEIGALRVEGHFSSCFSQTLTSLIS